MSKQEESLAELVKELQAATSGQAAGSILCKLCRSLISPEASFPGDGADLDDKQFALAIGAGLLETCLQVLAKYGPDSAGEKTERLFVAAGTLALMRKAGKSLREHAVAVRENADALLQSAHAETCKKYARLALAVVDKASGADRSSKDAASVTSPTCRWCLTTLSSGEKKQCAGCKRAIYCSRECQVRDWKEGGHKQECKLMATHDMQAEASGASKKEVKNAKRHEQNVSVAGARLFQEKVADIIMQATIQNYDILDCVVVLDFCHTPPTARTILATEFLKKDLKGDKAKQVDAEHTKSILKRNRKNGALTAVCKSPLAKGSFAPGGANGAMLLKTFPAPQPTWTELQQSYAQTVTPSVMAGLRSDPVQLEAMINHLSGLEV